MNAFAGRWGIVSMPDLGADLHEEEPAYIAFSEDGRGEFHVGPVTGTMRCREGKRDGRLSVEFTWEGDDEMDYGSGWAVRHADELSGEIAFGGGDVSGFLARLA